LETDSWNDGTVFRRSLLLAIALLVGCGGNAEQARIAEPEAAVELPTPTAEPATTTMPVPTATPASTATAVPEASPTFEPTTPPVTPTAVPLSCWTIDAFDPTTAGAWQIVLDGVMGGRSAGDAVVTDGALRMTGTVNTNGGGFVLIRRSFDPADLAGASQLRLTGETDGRGYEIVADDGLANRSRRVSHFATIQFEEGEPPTAGLVSFADLEARSLGTPVSAEPFRADLVQSIGVILADGVDGDFALRLERIEACA